MNPDRTPDELALRVPIIVGPTGAVMHDGHRYSMPPQAIGILLVLPAAREVSFP